MLALVIIDETAQYGLETGIQGEDVPEGRNKANVVGCYCTLGRCGGERVNETGGASVIPRPVAGQYYLAPARGTP